jgi:hypothetical protein
MTMFNPKMENQRAALALTNGVVLVSWASHEDTNLPWLDRGSTPQLATVGVAVTPDTAVESGRAAARQRSMQRATRTSPQTTHVLGSAKWYGGSPETT